MKNENGRMIKAKGHFYVYRYLRYSDMNLNWEQWNEYQEKSKLMAQNEVYLLTERQTHKFFGPKSLKHRNELKEKFSDLKRTSKKGICKLQKTVNNEVYTVHEGGISEDI